MALRLSDWVVRGELFNTSRNQVHGWIELKGVEHPLMIELTGNCDSDLAGWHFRFEARPEYADAAEPLPKIAWHQIGPTQCLTAARKVKPARTLEEAIAMRDLPREEWAPSLHLEWHSQNGRVVIDLIDPAIEYVEHRNFGDPPKKGPRRAPDDIDETVLESEEWSGNAGEGGTLADDPREAEDEQADPFGLVTPEFQRYLDEQSSGTDRAVLPDDARAHADVEDEEMLEIMLIDDVLENDEGEFIGSYLEPPGPLPPPSEVSDEEAEPILKMLLAHLALYGIALHMCEHFTPRDAYRVLMEEIAWEGRIHRRLLGTQWVQNYLTHEYCEKCEAQAEQEYEEMRKKKDGRESAGD